MIPNIPQRKKLNKIPKIIIRLIILYEVTYC